MVLPSRNYSLSDPDTSIYVADCRSILQDAPAGSVDVVFADPPYNIGQPYDACEDNLSWSEYLAFLRCWLLLCIRILSPTGSMFLWLPPKIANYAAVYLEENGLLPINDIVVVQRFGQSTRVKYVSGHVRLLYFAKSENRTWRPERILVPSDRASRYGDPRTQQSQTPGLRVPLDVWGENEQFFGRVQGNNAERRPLHPNQVPEAVLIRALAATTNPGDLVLDPFMGSGGTLTVARALGCRGIGIELSETYAASAFERIQNGPVRRELLPPMD